MNVYAVRITTEDSYSDFESIFKSSTKIICAHEYSKDNVSHYHLVVEMEINRTTLSRHIGKKYPGNAGHSLSVVRDLDKALHYVCKDGDIAVNNWGIDPVKFKEEFWEVNAKLKQNSGSQFDQILATISSPPAIEDINKIVWKFMVNKVIKQRKEFSKFRYRVLCDTLAIYYYADLETPL